MRNTGGEIVQVQGGHIIRSTAKKDRHSKVYTAKGPRDRRVRLAAHTAIQFYDVQDRLGYDRPSKAVDWLIKKAKSAIDKLDELPPWNPVLPDAGANAGSSMEGVVMETQQQSDSPGYGMSMNLNNESHFTPTSLESFFPTTSASLSLNLQNYPHNMMSNSENKPQDLCLSLHSYQDPIRGHQADQTLFVEPSSGSWADQQQGEMGRFSRMMGWNDESRGGYMFNNPPVYGSGQDQDGSDFSQRGTLQSSFVSPVHAWDNHDTHEIHRNSVADHHRFVSEGFSGFCVPARVYGNEELDDRHSSDSPLSHH